MKTLFPFNACGCVTALALLHSARALSGAEIVAAKQIVNPFGQTESALRSLEKNKQKQLQDEQGWKTCTRHHESSSGHLAQSPLPISFGLGNAAQVDRIEVIRPSGQRQLLADKIPVNSLLTISKEAP